MSAASRSKLRSTTSTDVRSAWIHGREIALLDVREEAHHAEAHPLFAANLPLSRIELDAYLRLPRRTVPVVIFDDGEGYAEVAVDRMTGLGYSDVSVLEGGLQGWRDAGYELFRDVNSPSKAFGELVESVCHTPSLSAHEVQALIAAGEDIAIVDVRRYDEFQTMSIPTAASAPGGELVWRMRSITQRPSTRVIVNCAGRTRSILGTQSLINADIVNPVAALRNGTIGWKLAKQVLDHGASATIPVPESDSWVQTAAAARKVADQARVGRTTIEEVDRWVQDDERTVYRFDVRDPGEYEAGHLPDFRNAPGGQLVQETDMFAPVRGAIIVLADSDGTRANMTGSWLAQMNWDVYVIDDSSPAHWTTQPVRLPTVVMPVVPADLQLSPQSLHQLLRESGATVLDFSRSRVYRKGHIPGSAFALRSRLQEALAWSPHADCYIVTSWEAAAAQLAWKELSEATEKKVYLLNGGNEAWFGSGYEVEVEKLSFASEPIDYYRRPYEGTDASPAAMQAYLDWEFGLVDQLGRDGSHGFRVLAR